MADAKEPSTHRIQIEAVLDPADASAWGGFVSRYEPFIRDLAWKDDRLQPGEADEVIQRVFVKLYEKLPRGRFDLNRRFRPWLVAVVRHVVADYLRDRRAPGGAVGGTSARERLERLPEFVVFSPCYRKPETHACGVGRQLRCGKGATHDRDAGYHRHERSR
jgi:DNA-directed RNA polymerase specialized sigma24 family protein